MAGAHKDWLATNLNPNWLKTFKVSRDPRLAEKAIDRTRPLSPLRPRQIKRRAHDHKRHGTTRTVYRLPRGDGEVLGRTRPKRAGTSWLRIPVFA